MKNTSKIRTFRTYLGGIAVTAIISCLVLSQTSFALTDDEYEAYITQLKIMEVIEEETLDIKADITQSQFLRYILRNSPDFDRRENIKMPKEGFTNVSNIMPYAKYVYTGLNAGILKVTEDKRFNPKKKINKVEGLKMIFDLYGISAPKLLKSDRAYEDVIENAWYIPYIVKAMDLNLIEAENLNIFGIRNNLTVQETARILIELNVVLENQRQPKEVYIGSPNIEKIDILYDVYDKIQEFYFYENDINNSDLIYKAIGGLVNSLDDRYSVFNTPEGTEDFMQQNTGEFQGVGMWIEKEGDYISVAGVVPNSPAEEANMKVGDLILKVNGVDIKGWAPAKVANAIRGPAGSEVTIFIEKHVNKRRMNVTLKRAKIEIKFVDGEILDKYYAYFDISQFPQDLKNDFDSIAKDIVNNRTRGIILDLRNNPGGYVSAAEDLLSYFLDKEDTMYYLDYKTNDRLARAKATGIYAGKYPVVVLIDSSSASASEIVAAALRDHEVATLIGDKTFGKGVAQQLFFYDDGSSLKLTIAEWLSPNKTRINKEGIKPDTQVIDREDTKTDEVIDKALRHLKNVR